MALGKIKPTGRSISVTFPVELFDKLNADAEKNGLSFSRMVNMACRRYYGQKRIRGLNTATSIGETK